MIYIGFAIRNPFQQLHRMIKDWVIPVSKNKTIEIGLYRNNSIIGGSFGITGFKQDHAGFNFDIDLLGYNLDFIFYDNRHYDERGGEQGWVER
jgi:hypothetical protein